MVLRWIAPGVTISPELKLLQYNILQPLQLRETNAFTAEKNGTSITTSLLYYIMYTQSQSKLA